MIIVSFYTPGNYEKVMNSHLRPSLEKWGLKHYIEEVPDLGNWFKNTSFKSHFMLKCFNEFKEDLCFIDADGVIEEFPELLFNIPENCDVAAHQLDWEKYWKGKSGSDHREFLSGTLFMRYTPEVLDITHDWIEQCENDPGTKEQKILGNLIDKSTAINFFNLPASYCAIINHSGIIPEYIGKPVITHHQASRKYKSKH
ncbi:MAG: hypothetical protein M0R03_16975 [Novosphingobium sp.]|nr:hypothetical protein [Novosphingobium sp.]